MAAENQIGANVAVHLNIVVPVGKPQAEVIGIQFSQPQGQAPGLDHVRTAIGVLRAYDGNAVLPAIEKGDLVAEAGHAVALHQCLNLLHAAIGPFVVAVDIVGGGQALNTGEQRLHIVQSPVLAGNVPGEDDNIWFLLPDQLHQPPVLSTEAHPVQV